MFNRNALLYSRNINIEELRLLDNLHKDQASTLHKQHARMQRNRAQAVENKHWWITHRA